MAGSDPLSLTNKDGQAFLMKGTDNRPIGYSYNRYSTVGVNDETQLQINSQQYEHNFSRIESTFWFDGTEKRFRWKTSIQQVNMGRPREYTLVRDADGTISLNTNTGEDKKYTCDGLLLPELLLPECASLLLEQEQNDLAVDVLSATSLVVPTIMKKMDIRETSARSEQIAFAVKADFLNNQNSFEELYFDQNRRFIGRFERLPLRRRIWDLTTPEQLKQIFGESFKPINENVAAVKITNKIINNIQ
jgi:hypothetical protein